MATYNYKSDLPPILITLTAEGEQVHIPECDFLVRFYIDGDEGRHYDCSHVGGVWKRCEPSQDGMKLICYLDSHHLGTGSLCAEFHYIRPDMEYEDGAQKSVVIADSGKVGIELVDGNGTLDVELVEITLPFIYRTAYDIAKANGYTGNAEAFYKALVSVVGIADAEEQRIANENERKANEMKRIVAEDGREKRFGEIEASFNATTEAFESFENKARSNEANRESNETERQQNEDKRISAEEQRKANENERKANEAKRQQELKGVKEDIDTLKESVGSKADRLELAVVLTTMGVELDNVGNDGDSVIMIQPTAGSVYYSSKRIFYQKTDEEAVDLGAPSGKKIYCNAVTGLLYIWKSNAWSQVGGHDIDAYTRAESEARYAKLKDTTQRITAYDVTSNMVTANSLWLTDEDGDGINVNKDGDRINVEGDYILTEAQIVKTTGSGTGVVMSQKATTDAINSAVSDRVTTEDFNGYSNDMDETLHDMDETLQDIDANSAYRFLGAPLDLTVSDYTLAGVDVKRMQSLVGRLLTAQNGNAAYVNEAVFACGLFDGTPDGYMAANVTLRCTMCYVDNDLGWLHFIFCVCGQNWHLYTTKAVSATDTSFTFKLAKF